MPKTKSLIVFSFVCFFLLSASARVARSDSESKTKADKPNILMIFLDDYGWKDTSYMGSDFYETPNIDALAKGGMVFTDAYSCAANCAPARACLLSGQYTPRHKLFNVGTGPRGKKEHRRLKHVPGVDTLDRKNQNVGSSTSGRRLQNGHNGQVAFERRPVAVWFRLEYRRNAFGRAAQRLLSSAWQRSESSRSPCQRICDGPIERRGLSIHHGKQGAAVDALPDPFRRSYTVYMRRKNWLPNTNRRSQASYTITLRWRP